MTSSADSSLRRSAPAKPTSSSARSRAPSRTPGSDGRSAPGMVAISRARSAVHSAVLAADAMLWSRRMPDHTSRTPGMFGAESSPAARWAIPITVRRRLRVLVARVPANEVR
ncbi:MAG: hypothetical protein ACRDRK_06200 [Pseudonocardia sp.]